MNARLRAVLIGAHLGMLANIPLIGVPDEETKTRREKAARLAHWRRSLSKVTRQQKRRGLFAENLSFVNRKNVQKNRHGIRREDQGGNWIFDLSRKDRRKLARAWAAKEWRDRGGAA